MLWLHTSGPCFRSTVASLAILSTSCSSSVSHPESGQLRILQRQVDPPLLVSNRLDAAGQLEIVTLVPSGKEIVAVQRGYVEHADSLLARLESAGFFDWADSTLRPPPGLDVESDPLVVEMRRAALVRRLATREPYLPAALRSVIGRLQESASNAAAAESCVVCVAEMVRRGVPDAVDVRGRDTLAVLQQVVHALTGPFPVVYELSAGRRLIEQYGRIFAIQASRGTHRVTCHSWPQLVRSSTPTPER